MNTRQVTTGTLLTASLLLGGAGLAGASPDSPPAMDRGVVPCEALLDRVDGLQNAISHMETRRGRLEARLADAQADGDARRAHRIERQIHQVDQVVTRLQAKIDQVTAVYGERCEVQGT